MLLLSIVVVALLSFAGLGYAALVRRSRRDKNYEFPSERGLL
jgi:hypothetical protein